MLAAASLSFAARPAAVAQTLADGFDAEAGVGELETTSVSFDGPDLPAGLWRYDSSVHHDGIDSIKSALPNRSESRLLTSVEGPALVSFWWKLNAVPNGDRLYFFSRNDQVNLTGVQDWQQRTFQVDTGTQPLEWLFERHSVLSVGDPN